MIARGLAMNGAKVYISGRRMETLDKAASSLDAEAKGSIHSRVATSPSNPSAPLIVIQAPNGRHGQEQHTRRRSDH